MSALHDAATDTDPAPVILLEDSGTDGAGPPLLVSTASDLPPAPRPPIVRLEDWYERARPVVMGLMMLAAIGASVVFAWQSRSASDRPDSDLDQALAGALTSEPGGAASLFGSDGLDVDQGAGDGRSSGDIDGAAPTTVARSPSTTVGTLSITSTSAASTSTPASTTTTSTSTSTSTASTSTASTASTATSAATSTQPATSASTDTTAVSIVKLSSTTRSTTTTTRETTTTSTTTTTLPTNPVGQFTMVNRATGQCASGQPAIIDQQACGADSNQVFRFESMGDDMRIVEIQTGEVLDVEGGSERDGASIIPWPWHGGGNQRWYVRPVGSAYEIVGVESGKCITVGTGGDDGSRRLFQRTCEQLNRQLWALS